MKIFWQKILQSMMEDFWNKRYAEHQSVYGTMPNLFFKNFIDQQKPGTLLLPAEGEGRNALYAAAKGWQVDAFDFSKEARKKTLSMAVDHHLKINYETKKIQDYSAGKLYDLVALIYVHTEPLVRKAFHAELVKSIKPGGFLILEAFSKSQLAFKSGGPSDINMLFDTAELNEDFKDFQVIQCEQLETELDEGAFHKGMASVVRFVGLKQ